ncbi:MAG: hypothetical protein KDC02_20500 [Flavobacteriales bacterium]|nr:hypothetical protein [Flavobacteriales bacterium]
MEPNTTPIPYLGDHPWSAISREERFFCAELFFTLSRMKSLKPFIAWLNAQCDLDLPEDDHWNVGYEVCFYRDLAHAVGLAGTKSIRDKKVPGTENEPFMFKRTFDLALFHPEHLIIMEAKAQQGLTSKQLSVFSKDRRDIEALLEAMNAEVPKVHLLLLAQQRYLDSKRGKAKEKVFAGGISWKMLAEWGRTMSADPASIAAFERADSVT